jgi:hypothetical protein
MGLKAQQIDAVTPPGGKRNHRLAPGRKKNVALGTLRRPRPKGGLAFPLGC